jgi:hypothetical protein
MLRPKGERPLLCPKEKKWIVKNRKPMKKVKNGFENHCSDAESGLRTTRTKNRTNPGNEK